MTEIIVEEGEDISAAIRRFNNLCRKEHLIKDYRRSQRYEKPSEKRRREKLESIKRRKRQQKRVRRR